MIENQIHVTMADDPMTAYMRETYFITPSNISRIWFADRAVEIERSLRSGKIPDFELPEKERFSVDALVGKIFELHQIAESRTFEDEQPDVRGSLIDVMGKYEYDLSRPDYLNKLSNKSDHIKRASSKPATSRRLLEKSIEHTSRASEILGESPERDSRIAYCLTELRRYDEAIPLLEKLRLESSKNRIISALAMSYIGAGRVGDGIDAYIGIITDLSENNRDNFTFRDIDNSMEKAFYALRSIRDKDTSNVLHDFETLYRQMMILWNSQRHKEGKPPKVEFNLISSLNENGFNKFREALSNLPTSQYKALQAH